MNYMYILESYNNPLLGIVTHLHLNQVYKLVHGNSNVFSVKKLHDIIIWYRYMYTIVSYIR